MRHGRAKAARKTLQFFHRTQGIRPPYNVLLDGNFVVTVFQYKLPIEERLDRLLQHERVLFSITRSSLQEMQNLQKHIEGKNQEKANVFRQAYEWATEHCMNILEEDDIPQNCCATLKTELGPPGKDIYRIISGGTSSNDDTNNKKDDGQQQQKQPNKYFVASQDEDLLDVLRNLGGGCAPPIIRLARGSVLLLEHPSKALTEHEIQHERKKWSLAQSMTEKEKQLVDLVKEQERTQRREQQQQQFPKFDKYTQRKKSNKAKGPNPLSCKRKHADDNDNANKGSAGDTSKNKRRRRKKSSSPTTSTNGEDKSNKDAT